MVLWTRKSFIFWSPLRGKRATLEPQMSPVSSRPCSTRRRPRSSVPLFFSLHAVDDNALMPVPGTGHMKGFNAQNRNFPLAYLLIGLPDLLANGPTSRREHHPRGDAPWAGERRRPPLSDFPTR